MKKWIGYLIFALLLVVVAFFVVSLILASFHNVGIVEEWQSWFSALKPAKDTVNATAKIFLR